MTKRDRSTTALTPAERGIARTKEFKAKLAAPTTTHWFTWRHVRCKVEATADYNNPGWTLLQLHVIAARNTPCPITATGYLAHAIDDDELVTAGGAEAFIAA